jgi:phosphoribosylaminoimidazole-succinocarboxamide synthase
MAKTPEVLLHTKLPLPLFIRGKVRDTYELDGNLLIIATDRISAFDVILPNGIPGKGKVLTLMSAFWFEKTRNIIANHLVEVVVDTADLNSHLPPESRFDVPTNLSRRAMIVNKARRLPIECVVRGYLSGSGWAEYKKTSSICGINLPKGLVENQELPEPVFTPTTKAETGHDLPMTMKDVASIVGQEVAETVKDKSIAIYRLARDYARTRGFIIADTKMEFGLEGNKLMLIDELLTPDSSRFWDIEKYQVGQPQDSYDKQPVRDWLETTGWNKTPPAPELPPDIVASTSERYQTAYERLTGKKFPA